MEPPSPTAPGARPKRSLNPGQRRRDAGVERRRHPALRHPLDVDGDVRPLVGADGRDEGVARRLRVDVGRQRAARA